MLRSSSISFVAGLASMLRPAIVHGQSWGDILKDAANRRATQMAEEAIDKGKDQLLKAMRKEGVSVHRLLSTSALATVAADLRQNDVSALYASIGEGRISPQTVIHRLVATAGGAAAASDDAAEGVTPQGITKMRPRSDSDPGVTVIGSQLGDVWVKLARCCTPVPGDEITGVDYDDDLGVVVVRTPRETSFEEKLQKKVRTSYRLRLDCDMSPVSRYYQGAKLLQIVEGTSEIQRMILGRLLAAKA